MRVAAADLTALQGLRSSELTLAAAEAAVELATLGNDHSPPPAGWLHDLPAAERAVERVVPLLEAESAARERARSFEPAVLDLDLEGLAERFAHEHRGLKKLGGAYKADRDALGATAPTIKPKQAIAQIGDAIAWQQARAALLDGADTRVLAEAWDGPETTGPRSAARAGTSGATRSPTSPTAPASRT